MEFYPNMNGFVFKMWKFILYLYSIIILYFLTVYKKYKLLLIFFIIVFIFKFRYMIHDYILSTSIQFKLSNHDLSLYKHLNLTKNIKYNLTNEIIDKFVNLKQLTLNNNKKLPNTPFDNVFLNLKNLECLKCAYVDDINENIHKLKKLKCVVITNSRKITDMIDNSVKKMPDNFYKLKKLKSLIINDNVIIDKNIYNFKNLKCCVITSIKSTISPIIAKMFDLDYLKTNEFTNNYFIYDNHMMICNISHINYYVPSNITHLWINMSSLTLTNVKKYESLNLLLNNLPNGLIHLKITSSEIMDSITYYTTNYAAINMIKTTINFNNLPTSLESFEIFNACKNDFKIPYGCTFVKREQKMMTVKYKHSINMLVI